MIGPLLEDGDASPGVINSNLPSGSADELTASWILSNDGSFSISGAGAGNWVSPANATIAAFYEAHVAETSGAFDSGTVDTWLDLATGRTWTLDFAPGGTSVSFTVQIREKASGIVRTSQNLTLQTVDLP